MATMMDHYDRTFDEHSSLNHSLVDFDYSDREQSPVFGIPSQHSGFRSEESESEPEPTFAPAAWTQSLKRGSGLYQHQQYLRGPSGRSRSRETSHESTGSDRDDRTSPASIPLPASTPASRRGTPYSSPEPEPAIKQVRVENGEQPAVEGRQEVELPHATEPGTMLRFSMRAEMQHNTNALETAIKFFNSGWLRFSRSWTSIFTHCMVAFLAASMFSRLITPPTPGPAPDLATVASFARTFEPLIYYSEGEVQQMGDLQATGMAVWDLGESVRSANMTSAPLIVNQLDDLSDNLKSLALELTKFFANVNGDVDSILIGMDWAKRELNKIAADADGGALKTALSNMHVMLCRVGVLETSHGQPTTVGEIIKSLFGESTPQRERAALQRTFDSFLNLLEESIDNELSYSVALFGLFEAVDKQFRNLQSTVSREADAQEREQDDMLSNLWTKLVGPNAARIKKFEKNKELLAVVKQRTDSNKRAVADHNTRLLQLKTNLEILRKKIVSPLVRSHNASTLSIAEQIAGLEDTHDYLKNVREQQKTKRMEAMYGYRNRIDPEGAYRNGREIEGSAR